MHSPRSLTVLAILALLAGSSTATTLRAQSIPSPYRFVDSRQEAGFTIGHLAGGAGLFGLGPDGGVLYGARYGVDVSGPFGLEGAASYFPSTRDLIDPRRPMGDRSSGKADVSLVLIDARLRFSLTGSRTWHSLSPFLFAGGGLGFDVANRPEAESQLREQDRFSFGVKLLGLLGGGVRWMATDRILVRGDTHLTLWQLSTPDGFQDPVLNLQAPPQNEWVNNAAFTLGIAYRF